MKVVLIIFFLIIIGLLNEIVVLFFRYNCKKMRYMPFVFCLFYVIVLLICLHLEKNNMVKFAYGIGIWEFIFQFCEWIINDWKYRKEYSVLSTKINCLMLAFEWMEKENLNLLLELFYRLKDVKLNGIMIMARDKRRKELKVMFFIRKNESSSKLDNICNDLGKCEIHRENAKKEVIVCSLSLMSIEMQN